MTINKEITTTDKCRITWLKSANPVNEEFSIGSVLASFTISDGTNVLAKWVDSNGAAIGPAIVRKNNAAFISWSPALQGGISTNAALIGAVIDDLVLAYPSKQLCKLALLNIKP